MSRTRRRQPSHPIIARVEADIAYLFRLKGASWTYITERMGFASTGHAHNVVNGGDNRAYAPARDLFG